MFNPGDRVQRMILGERVFFTGTVLGACHHGYSDWLEVMSDNGNRHCCKARRLRKIEEQETKIDYTQGF